MAGAGLLGIIGMTKSAAMDYGAQGIRTHALAPGSPTTPMMPNAFEGQASESQQSIFGTIPMRTPAEPEDQAEAVVWL